MVDLRRLYERRHRPEFRQPTRPWLDAIHWLLPRPTSHASARRRVRFHDVAQLEFSRKISKSHAHRIDLVVWYWVD